MHLKRNEMPKSWPLKRKGTKYLVRPTHNLKKGISLLIVLRDMLKLAKNRKELRAILNAGRIKVNQKTIKNEKFPLNLFDVLNLDDKSFRLIIENGKFNLKEIKGKEAEGKIAEIIGKKILKGNKIQINLSDGRNYITKDKVEVGDSAVINFKENKITEILEFKSKAKVFFVSGKHMGKEGIIKEIDEKRKIVVVKLKSEEINTNYKTIMVVK